MLARLAFFCLLAAALTGCASYNAARDTRGWFFNTDGEVKLVYGAPQSDDVALMLSCQPRSGRVLVSQSALRPGDGITLSSAGRQATLYGEAEPDRLNGGVMMMAETSATSPVLTAFRDTGRVGVVENGRSAELYATAAEQMQIREFFGACAA